MALLITLDPDGTFQVPRTSLLTPALPRLRHPLDLNTVAQLRTLGKVAGLSFPLRMRKELIVEELNRAISSRPLDTTIAKYPALQDIDYAHLTTIEQCLWVQARLNTMWPQDRDEAVHFKIMRNQLQEILTALEWEREAEDEAANEPPNWMSYASYQAPEVAHWRIRLEKVDEGCSDSDTVVTCEIVFLPLTDEYSGVVWTGKRLAAKRTWSQLHICCNPTCCAEARYELLGFERVEV